MAFVRADEGRGIAAAGVGAEEYGAEQSHRTCATMASRSATERFPTARVKFDLHIAVRRRAVSAVCWFCWCMQVPL